MNKLFLIIGLIIFPLIVFGQSFNKNELKAFADYENEKYSDVLDSLDYLLQANQKPELYLLKAQCLYELKKYSDAMDICVKLDRIKPRFSSSLKLKLNMELNNTENAQLALNENLNSTYKLSLNELLNSEEFSGIYAINLDQMALSGDYFSQTEKQLYQVERLIDKSHFSQALFIIDEIINRKWDTPDAHYFKSIVLVHENDLRGAKNAINSAIILKKSKAKYYIQRIHILSELEEYDLALTDVNKLIRIETYNIDHYIQKADLLFKANYFDEAQELTSKILEILPNNPNLLYLSSKSNYKNSNYLEALLDINRAFEFKTSKEFYELRGDIYSATGTYKYAVQDYSMYLDIDPRSGEIYAKKGLARFNLGDKKGACSDWVKAKRYGSYDAVVFLEKYCNNQNP
ncbi:MAG: hypothetical protein C0597_01030 [Marinilabiliales bacterium]|nr:MAG: hypothetical protein C0597_01030 [Marinilabiliales bacterium]